MLIATMTYHTTHQEGRSALSLAAERGDVDVIKVLIEGGADVNTQNKVIMYRSLHYTWSLVHREQIICIYAHGGDPGDKATLMCVCTLALLDPSVFT